MDTGDVAIAMIQSLVCTDTTENRQSTNFYLNSTQHDMYSKLPRGLLLLYGLIQLTSGMY